MEQLDYNLLFRWFVGLSFDDPGWNHSVFSRNRDRLFNTKAVSVFFSFIHDQAKKRGLISNEDFTLDGTLLEAWASMKSFQPKYTDNNSDNAPGRNPSLDFRGQKRSNDTHASRTEPDARLYRKAKGQESKSCYMGHALMENRNGLVDDTRVTEATGTTERQATWR